jgi:predicted phage tail protein
MFIPKCQVKFMGVLETYEPLELYAFHVRDVLNGIGSVYERFNSHIYELTLKGFEFAVKVNGVFKTCETELVESFQAFNNDIEIHSLVSFAGKGIFGIIAGVGLLALSFTGVGLLGISATTFGLLGASLLFSSIFSSPKTDSNKPADKRSVNFSGTVNVIGGSSPVPLVMGRRVFVGSIVVSADLIPQQRGLS